MRFLSEKGDFYLDVTQKENPEIVVYLSKVDNSSEASLERAFRSMQELGLNILSSCNVQIKYAGLSWSAYLWEDGEIKFSILPPVGRTTSDVIDAAAIDAVAATIDDDDDDDGFWF